MKFSCNQVDFNNAIASAYKAVASRPSHVILSNLLIEASKKNQQITLVGFDLTMSIKIVFGGDVQSKGKFTVPGKLLADIVSRMEGYINVTLSDNEINIESLNGKYEVRGMGAEEFPELPEIPKDKEIELSVSALLEGIKGTSFCTSTDETKQVLTGVNVRFNCGSSQLIPDTLEFAATDGHRLSVVNPFIENGEELARFLGDDKLLVTIPSRALHELKTLLGKVQNPDETYVKISLGSSLVYFVLSTQEISSRILEGDYPSYPSLFPKEYKGSFTCDRKELIGSVERLGSLASEKNNVIKYIIGEDRLTITVDSADVGNGREILKIERGGESIDFGLAFNYKYLLEGLKVIPGNEIVFNIKGEVSPVVISPVNGNRMQYLVMPIQLRS